MAVFLPVVTFVLCIGLLGRISRENFLFSSVLWSVFVFVNTELLSIGHQLDYSGLVISWCMALAGIIICLVTFKPRLSWQLATIQIDVLVIVLMGVGILLATGIIAWNAAPNNWDSMTTHLARVAHWAQNKTIAFYPTSMLKQLNYPPWAQYAMAQFYILGRNDQWVNFIQWFSSLGCMIGSSLIVARLKGSVCAQALAALMVATIPMGILQSTSTQNDYVVAFWLVCFIYFGLSLLENRKWSYCLAAGASLGLAWLIKGTGYIYAFPFLGWFFVAGFKKYGRSFIFRMAVILVVAGAINSTYYFRNWALTGALIPPSESAHIIGTGLDWRVFLSNLILNAGLHLASPWDGFNNFVESAVSQIHHWIGISEGDGRVCMSTGATFHILTASFRLHEDYAGNGVHFILIMIAIVAYGFIYRKIPSGVKYYLLGVSAGVILFLMMIKWSPYHARYHLPVFVLFSPFVAIVASHFVKSRGAVAIAVILTGLALPWVLYNKSRPLLGQYNVFTTPRMEQYFANKLGDFPDGHIVREITRSGCKDVGLAFGGDTWEYPLWAIARQWDGGIRFEHVLVDNVSQNLAYPLGDFNPCLIIQEGVNGPQTIMWAGQFYLKIDEQGTQGIYLRADLGKS